MKLRKTLPTIATTATLAMMMVLAPAAAHADGNRSGGEGHGHGETQQRLVASGLQGAVGSTIGPDGALYVTERTIGQVTRIDLQTGEASAYATGLPVPVIPLGGAIDVAFIDDTAYVLVTTVGDDVPGDTTNDVDGIYRIDDQDSATVIADIGEWSKENPPPDDIAIEIARGVQYAMQPIRDGFLVTDGHHNRVVRATMSGEVSEVIQYRNIVPTGITTRGPWVFVAEAGPVPHEPSTGKVSAFGLWNLQSVDLASGYSLVTDVAFGPCGLYAVSQGDSPGDVAAGSPALPESGELLKVARDGSFTVVASDLDLPTSVAFQRGDAYVVTLDGEVWKIDNVAAPHHRGWGCFAGNHRDWW